MAAGAPDNVTIALLNIVARDQSADSRWRRAVGHHKTLVAIVSV